VEEYNSLNNMRYNLNAGYGRLQTAGAPFLGSGKLFVVGDSSTKNLSMLKELFDVDLDGKVRFQDSISGAVSQAEADAGDLIMVMSGHIEEVNSAGALDLNKAGITIRGIGKGDKRPQIQFTTDTGADMDVSSAAVTMENILFVCNKDGVIAPIDVNAADFQLIDCEFRDSADDTSPVDWLIADENADRMIVKGLIVRASTADADDSLKTAISLASGSTSGSPSDVEISDFNIVGDFKTAAIENVNNGVVRLNVHDGYIQNFNSDDIGVTVVSTATGKVGPNLYVRIADDAANITEAVAIGNAHAFNPIEVVNANGERAMQWNGIQSTDA